MVIELKKIFLLIFIFFFLIGCSNSAVENNNDKETETIVTDEITPSQPNDSETDAYKDLGEVKGYYAKYNSNPTSEPDFNKQLSTINPLGSLATVWDYYRGDDVVVAVIDSGFDINHPEFERERISDLSAYIYTDVKGNVNIKVGVEETKITDGDSHGTMCAGLLGASDNDYGISGIAPNATLMFIKIDKKYTSFAETFKYAADNGAKVISTSLGTYPNTKGESSGDVIFPAGVDISKVFNENIKYAHDLGVTIIAATGNSKTTTPSYPAACDYVIGAGGLNAGSMTSIWDSGYEGSNYNGNKVYVDVFAPSDNIYAPGFDTSTNKSTYWSGGKGTSFSAPLIAGAAALYFEKYPTASNDDFELSLKNTCVNINSYNQNKNMGWGRINISALLNIEEDIVDIIYDPSETITVDATNLKIIDEAGWNFTTLHLFDVTFASGYGYTDLEKYFTYMYGERVLTKNYKLESNIRCWAYTDESYIGDYYLCQGSEHLSTIPTTFEYQFPSWVIGFSYQIVNNYNWMPEGGNKVTKSNGYLKEVSAYFWYNNSNSFGLSQVVGNKYQMDLPAVCVTIKYIGVNNSSYSEVVSAFDYLQPDVNNKINGKNFIGYYVGENCSILFENGLVTTDLVIYALYK